MKLAFVGVENSHAPAFLQLIQKNPEKYSDIEVVGVYSYDGAAADKLLEQSLDNGGRDNVSLILIDLTTQGEESCNG